MTAGDGLLTADLRTGLQQFAYLGFHGLSMRRCASAQTLFDAFIQSANRNTGQSQSMKTPQSFMLFQNPLQNFRNLIHRPILHFPHSIRKHRMLNRVEHLPRRIHDLFGKIAQ